MRDKKYSDDEMLASLRTCYQVNHNRISQNLYATTIDKPSVDAISARFGSWNQALEKAGLPVYKRNPDKKPVEKSKTYSDEFILSQLRRCYEEHGNVSMKTYSNAGYKPGRTLIAKQFGSWNKAVQAAGLDAVSNHSKQFSHEDIFQQLRECYEENDNFLSMDIYVASNRSPKVATIIKYFGSWNEAIKQAGLQPNASNIELYTDEDILNALRDFYLRNGHYISTTLYQESGTRPGLPVIQKRFGSWNNALSAADIPLNKEMEQKYTKEEIIRVLRDFYENNGIITREFYMLSGQIPHLHTIINYFGTWESALEEADIDTEKDRKQYTKEEIIQSIQRCYQDSRKTMTISTYINGDYLPKLATIRRVFGSWEQAVEAANLRQFQERYTKEEVLEILRECYEQNHGKLSMSDYRHMRVEPTVSFIKHMFNDSWNTALEQASLDVNIRYYSDEEIYSVLREVYEDNDKNITLPLYKDSGKRPLAATIIHRFGSWKKALKRAGIGIQPDNYS